MRYMQLVTMYGIVGNKSVSKQTDIGQSCQQIVTTTPLRKSWRSQTELGIWNLNLILVCKKDVPVLLNELVELRKTLIVWPNYLDAYF